ncbi:hypothetical protein lerEdw1_015522 [Lerista edwardsae]|nr:hypothetical protein lerEdw1_015522 [Lerista edwardsae]
MSRRKNCIPAQELIATLEELDSAEAEAVIIPPDVHELTDEEGIDDAQVVLDDTGALPKDIVGTIEIHNSSEPETGAGQAELPLTSEHHQPMKVMSRRKNYTPAQELIATLEELDSADAEAVIIPPDVHELTDEEGIDDAQVVLNDTGVLPKDIVGTIEIHTSSEPETGAGQASEHHQPTKDAQLVKWAALRSSLEAHILIRPRGKLRQACSSRSSSRNPSLQGKEEEGNMAAEEHLQVKGKVEFQNSNPEMSLITEEGVETPLSLVQMVEDFEIGPYQGDGAKDTMQSDSPQQEIPASMVHLQYTFMHKSEGGALRGKLSSSFCFSEQGTNLQKKEYEFMSCMNNPDLSSEPLQVHSTLVGDSDAANPQQENQTTKRRCTAAQPKEWILSQRSEQSMIQNAAGLNPPPGNPSGEKRHTNRPEAEESSIHTGEKSQPCNKSGERSNEQVSFSVWPNARCSHQLTPSGKRSCKCPRKDHPFSDSSDLSGHQIILSNDWERLFSRLSLSPKNLKDAVNKPFKCPDCGRGFVHKSSIPRHLQKCQRKENPSSNSGHERSFSLGPGHFPYQKLCLEEKPLRCPDSGTSVVKGKAKNLSGPSQQCAPPSSADGLSSAPGAKSQKCEPASIERLFQCSICGKTFAVKSSLARHQFLHGAERPFKCFLCNKGYIQKCHLKRHFQKHHITHSSSNE